MRRMITNKQVVNIVNEAIDDGEIEVGGLPEIESGDAGKALVVNSEETGVEWGNAAGLPEIESGDAGKLLAVKSDETGAEWVEDDNLKLPISAPAAQQLVGLSTSGTQNALEIGDGLGINDGKVISDTYVLKLAQSVSGSWNQDVSLSSELIAGIKNQTIKYIIILFGKSSADQSFYSAFLTNTPITGYDAYFQGVSTFCSQQNETVDNIEKISFYYNITASLATDATLLHISGSQKFPVATYNIPTFRMWASGNVLITSGTFAASKFNYLWNGDRTITVYAEDTDTGGAGTATRFCYFHKCYVDTTNGYAYFRNIPCTAVPNTYELKVNTSNRSWTLTQI